MSDNLPHPLCTEIDHWNSVIRLRYHQFLETLTALRLDDAKHHLAVFENLLTASMDFADQQLDTIGDESDPALKMIRADHLILRRTTARVRQSLIELEQAYNNNNRSARSALVDMLDIFVRLDNILNHHAVRAQDALLPLLRTEIDLDAGNQLAVQYTAVMQRAQPN